MLLCYCRLYIFNQNLCISWQVIYLFIIKYYTMLHLFWNGYFLVSFALLAFWDGYDKMNWV